MGYIRRNESDTYLLINNHHCNFIFIHVKRFLVIMLLFIHMKFRTFINWSSPTKCLIEISFINMENYAPRFLLILLGLGLEVSFGKGK